ncbi:MAG: DNA repair protein RecN [Ktedonobacter sp. 13_2_20CM_2_54_8]|nr:MAG: DNA repair protein RecN [Ktedonobacter sp. 13_2_20CM_53_11]OLB60534.1 MAG: DNA repair protein RecN [Ktedonobacter sp. 13_2_20CM_2_54_8]
MLLELTIKDFAIIDSLHLRLHRLFNVFTGETGAGKSIIIDAVNTLLGGKIGAEYVRAGCERATVEGVFSIDALPAISDEWTPVEDDEGAAYGGSTNGASTVYEAFDQAEASHLQRLQVDAASADARIALAALLREYDITPEDGQLILSRDIFRSSGRTVARINGRALSQQVLQQVASWLVDIHGQSEHMSLLRPDQHVNFLDRYAELLPLRAELGTKVTEWRNARKTLQSLQQTERDQSRRAEFLRFEIDEIERAELRPGEIEELEEERKVLSNAEHLREHCELVYGAIKGADVGGDDYKPAMDQLRIAQRSLGELARLDKSLQEYADNLAEAIYQLEDVAASISSYESDIEDDPRRLSEIEERLDQIARLKRKYGATIEEILERAAEDQAELDTITNRDEIIAKLQGQDSEYRREIGQIAQELSARRQEAAQRLSVAMEEQLNDLNMRRARFSVEIEQVPDEQGIPASVKGQLEQYYACDLTGIDRVQFLIAPNPGEPFKPLTKIASGGETSRLMLALKTILTSADATPTLIFDEIDAGISGQSGQIVGAKLWMLTQNHQVICVTHLPQIAAFADTHYNVSKQIFDDRTMTIVNELRPEQRVREIAHIMGGNVTEFSMKSAEEILARAYLWKERFQVRSLSPGR